LRDRSWRIITQGDLSQKKIKNRNYERDWILILYMHTGKKPRVGEWHALSLTSCGIIWTTNNGG
jgi:hypothetical protein